MTRDRTYTISDLAREFGCTTRALRFYEDEGLIAPLRDGLTRIYRPGDRERARLIVRLRNAGVSLPDVSIVLAAPESERNQAALDALSSRLAVIETEHAKARETIVAFAQEGASPPTARLALAKEGARG